MGDNGPTAPRPRRISTGRLEAFSDGVFAIAITILVLEITVPEGSQDDVLSAVLDQWPSYLAYVVSFSTIGAVWLGHNVVTDNMQHADALVVRLNLLLLLLVSFLPFLTRLLAENLGETDAERVAATIYGRICCSWPCCCSCCGGTWSAKGMCGPTSATRRSPY
jgi:uncharacterized membrane protein